MKNFLLLVGFLQSQAMALVEIKLWSQCGGYGVEGTCDPVVPANLATDGPYKGYVCASGLSCDRLNSWYWQCRPQSQCATPRVEDPVDTKPRVTTSAKSAPITTTSAKSVSQTKTRSIEIVPSPLNPPKVAPVSEYEKMFGVVPTTKTIYKTVYTVDKADPHNKVIDIAKNLPITSLSSSNHQTGNLNIIGRALNYGELDDIFVKMGFLEKVGCPFYEKAVAKLDSINAYNKGQSAYQKWLGIYVAYSTAAKLKIVPVTLFKDAYAAGKVYAMLKKCAVIGDIAGMRKLIESVGGDTCGLSDTQLIGLWGSNEHHNLHAILFGNEDVSYPIHMTSINDNDKYGSRVGCAKGMCGGWNDEGQYPQWKNNYQAVPHWFTAAKDFPMCLGV